MMINIILFIQKVRKMRNIYRPKQLQFTYSQFMSRNHNMENMVLDKYVIYDIIEKGSFGNIYRGMNDITKKQVAIKAINLREIHLLKDQKSKASKLRLAQNQPKMMLICNSPHLLKCYDVYQNADLKILILEYCNGKTLQQEIDERGRIDQNEAVIILRHIINGLIEMHKHKIVHRDLKANNIMSHNGTYKIIDFGLSKKLQITHEMNEVNGTYMGTLTTMAPEVMSKQPYGLKADIWSLGIIFFQMIYGIYPYSSKQAFQRYQQINNKVLFSNNTPIILNGITPSQGAYDFLRFVLVVDTKSRPSWKQVSEHPLIKNINDKSINQRFLKICEVLVDEGLNCNQEIENVLSYLDTDKNFQISLNIGGQQTFVRLTAQTQSMTSNRKHNYKQQNQKKQSASKENVIRRFQRIPVEQKQQSCKITFKNNQQQSYAQKEQKKQIKQEQKIKILGNTVFKVQTGQKKPPMQSLIIAKEQIQQKKLQIDQSQDEQFDWTRGVHLECLKTQFIYRQIITPLQIGKVLKQNRSTIQFMYLLITRCFNNMSPVNFELQTRNKNLELIKNLSQQIEPLYKLVHQKFLQLSKTLTEIQSKVFSIVSDRFSKIFSGSSLKTKDNFLVGIEGEEYSKIQQICYTKTYYQQQIREKLKSSKIGISVLKKLDYYVEINSITTEMIKTKKKDFEAIVKDILSKSINN